jgi:hypothetical protein
MEAAIYGALDAIDAYRATLEDVIGEQEASGEPNEMLVKRMRQFQDRADKMTKAIEDEVLTVLMFCLDRLFSVKMAEDGEFI